MTARTFFLDLPFRERVTDVVYDKRLKSHVYVGNSLPSHLVHYHCKDHSLTRWHEDAYNKSFYPITPVDYTFTPRPHQRDAAKRIAAFRKLGFPGFYEGDSTGLGKTITTVLGIYASMQVMGERKANILVVCPKAVIGHWSNTFKALGLLDQQKYRIVIINYEQCNKLLTPPKSAKSAKRTRTKNRHIAQSGTPTVQWDYIVADESHKLKNSEVSQRSQAFERIARYGTTSSPFVIYVSATVAQTPLEMQYLRPLLYHVTKTPPNTPWKAWLSKYKFAVNDKGVWSPNKRDLAFLNKALFSSKSPSVRRKPEDVSGWPTISRNTLSSDLKVQEELEYEKEWLSFRSGYRLALRGKNPKSALAKQLRFRQKSSLIRAASTAEHIESFVENGYRVVVYVAFMESIDRISENLKCSYVEFSGRNEDVRERERLKFQRGQADVIFVTVKDSVSMHAGEVLPDGTKGDTKPRVTLCHDINYSALDMLQIEGRAHRDGQRANIYYLYANGTVEAKIASTMIQRMSAVSSIMDDEHLTADLDTILVGKNNSNE